MAPLVKMHTLGHDFVPPAIHAGGLRYHGMAPLVSQLVDHGLDRGARRTLRRRCFEAGVSSRAPRASCPRPRRTTPSRVAIDEALARARRGEPRTILFNLCGHGHFDLAAYEAYLAGELEDYEYVPLESAAAADEKELAGAAA